MNTVARHISNIFDKVGAANRQRRPHMRASPSGGMILVTTTSCRDARPASNLETFLVVHHARARR
jgi:hypothetical protein